MKTAFVFFFFIVGHLSPAFSDETPPATIGDGLSLAQSQMSSQPTDAITTQQQYIEFLTSNYTAAEKIIDSLAGLTATLDEQKEILRKKVIILENLHALGDATAAARLNGLIKEKLKDSDPAITRVARRFVLVSQAAQFFNLEPEKQGKALADIQDYVLKHEPCEDGNAVASALISQLLQATDVSMAADFSEETAHHFASSIDEEMQAAALKFAGAARRASLPGKMMEAVGHTLAGDKFDISSLKGKVVLVGFWSSGCPHCHAEAPQLKQLYTTWQPKGFEIVSVTLYDTRESAENYMAEKAISWSVLFDESAAGTNQHPIAKQYAITAVPTAILIGRDGKVISIQARGLELERLLGEQFPEMRSQSTEQN